MLYRLSWKDEMMIEGQRQGIRQVLLDLIEERFGAVPDDIRGRVEEIHSIDRLKRLSRKVLVAKSLKGLRLG
jgi:hypothetical protein